MKLVKLNHDQVEKYCIGCSETIEVDEEFRTCGNQSKDSCRICLECIEQHGFDTIITKACDCGYNSKSQTPFITPPCMKRNRKNFCHVKFIKTEKKCILKENKILNDKKMQIGEIVKHEWLQQMDHHSNDEGVNCGIEFPLSVEKEPIITTLKNTKDIDKDKDDTLNELNNKRFRYFENPKFEAKIECNLIMEVTGGGNDILSSKKQISTIQRKRSISTTIEIIDSEDEENDSNDVSRKNGRSGKVFTLSLSPTVPLTDSEFEASSSEDGMSPMFKSSKLKKQRNLIRKF